MGCLLDSLDRGYRVPGICSSSYWRSQTDAMENDGPLLTIGELARRAIYAAIAMVLGALILARRDA
jgi:hypothetical protein